MNARIQDSFNADDLSRIATIQHAKYCERGLLASLFADPSNVTKVQTIVSGEDFFDKEQGQLFTALVHLHGTGINIGDIIATNRELPKLGVPSEVCDRGYLYKLISEGLSANAVYYADEVRSAAELRGLWQLGTELLAATSAKDANPKALRELFQARIEQTTRGNTGHVKEFFDVAKSLVQELRTPEQRKPGMMTGFYSYDSVVGGWHGGELIVLAARTGAGKTAFALNVTRNLVLLGRSVLYVSLEMQDRELVRRELGSIAGVDSKRMRTGKVSEAEIAKLDKAANEFKTCRLSLYDPASASADNVRAVAKCMAAKGGLDLVVVDYIGLVRPQDNKRARHEQIGAITGALKRLAKELSIPVLALAQLNRDADCEEEPRLSHLRDSGSVEQDADIVTFIHRPNRESDAADVIIAKHRHGETGKLKFFFDGARTRFSDCREMNY